MKTAEELAEKLTGMVPSWGVSNQTRRDFADELRKWQQEWAPTLTYSGSMIQPTSTWNVPNATNYPAWGLVTPEPPKLTDEEREGYREQLKQGKACVQCGGFHLRACPRVKRLVMRNAEEIAEVEFWPDGQWPKDNVIFPEDVFEE